MPEDITDDDVKISRHKKILENLRQTAGEIENGSEQLGTGVGTGFSNGHVESRTGSNKQDTGSSSGPVKGNARGPEGTAKDNGATERIRAGARPVDKPGISPRQSTPDAKGRSGKLETEAVKDAKPHFNWKGAVKPNINSTLFSDAERSAELQKMIEIYYRGSGLLDDLLEICVKGHQPVQIWQLEEDEATTLATMHLQRATYDKKAAASARQLLALYDRLYMYLLLGPRAKATFDHVKVQGGFSFR
jgi:hypothetical protein